MGKYVVRYKQTVVRGARKTGKTQMMADMQGQDAESDVEDMDEGVEEPKNLKMKIGHPEKDIVAAMVGVPKKSKKELGEKGSAKSGNYGHRGIPGHQGGSAPRGSGVVSGGASVPRGNNDPRAAQDTRDVANADARKVMYDALDANNARIRELEDNIARFKKQPGAATDFYKPNREAMRREIASLRRANDKLIADQRSAESGTASKPKAGSGMAGKTRAEVLAEMQKRDDAQRASTPQVTNTDMSKFTGRAGSAYSPGANDNPKAAAQPAAGTVRTDPKGLIISHMDGWSPAVGGNSGRRVSTPDGDVHLTLTSASARPGYYRLFVSGDSEQAGNFAQWKKASGKRSSGGLYLSTYPEDAQKIADRIEKGGLREYRKIIREYGDSSYSR